jgi:AcrR family transcriptional regulator
MRPHGHLHQSRITPLNKIRKLPSSRMQLGLDGNVVDRQGTSPDTQYREMIRRFKPVYQLVAWERMSVVTTARDRIADAAFELFASRGYDATSVDDIAAAAGVGRSTFFRYYRTKEAVIFPDHDALLAQVESRLRASSERSGLRAVADAVRIVLFHYVSEGERARQRYALTSSVQALNDRELVSGARYQRLFRRYLAAWGDGSDVAEMRAEMMSASVVAAHNHVLRRWLRGESRDPHVDIEGTLARVVSTFAEDGDRDPDAIVILSSSSSLREVAGSLARMLENGS